MAHGLSFDDYLIEDDSDQERAESSDDDIDTMLSGFQQQYKQLCKRSKKEEDSSSDDEFEKEMAAELSATMNRIKAEHGLAADDTSGTSGTTKEPTQYYNTEYFDSDSDDEATSEVKKNTKHPKMSNDDLLYDPNMDDDDQRWIDKQRRHYQPAGKPSSGHQSVQALPSSDAVLNCPACMTLLCLDCQRHDIYHNQYRAMFVTNCRVIGDQVLRYPLELSKNKNRKRKKSAKAKADDEDKPNVADMNPDETYHPVVCCICNSEVAVYDSDEVYHFFNVLSSHT